MRSPGIFNSGCWLGALFRMACLKWRQDSMYGTARANAEPATGAVFLREQGTIFFPSDDHLRDRPSLMTDCLLLSPLSELEPALANLAQPAIYLKERSVDPRALTSAALIAARHRRVDISSGTAVTA